MSDAPTVLIATPYLPPHIGGVERYVAELSTKLRERHGWRVVIATTTPNPATAGTVAEVSGTAIYRLPGRWRLSNTPLDVGWMGQLSEIIRREQIDLVNAHAPVPFFADSAARAARDRPFVLTYHTGPMRKGNPATDLLLAGYERFVLSKTAGQAAAVITAADYVSESLGGPLGNRTVTISPGINTAVFDHSTEPEPDRLLFVASLERATAYKGLTDLLHALPAVLAARPTATLEVVGDGDARAGYENLAKQLGIAGSVVFRGALDQAGVALAYQRCSLMVLPTHFDSFPTVLLEAMASGRAVLSTRVGGIPNLVRDGWDATLVPPGDVPRLAETLQHLLSQPALLRSMGEAGRSRVVEEMSWEVQAAKTDRVFRDVLADRRRRTVAVVTPYYPPNIGGVQLYAEQIAQRLSVQPDLRSVVLTTRTSRRQPPVSWQDGVKVIRLRPLLRVSNTPVNPLWLVTLHRLLRRENVSLVNAHSPVPFLADVAAAAAGDRPVVLTYHAGSMLKGSPLTDVLIQAYERHLLPRLFGRADQVVSVSPTTLAHEVPHAITISPGVDVDRFHPPATPRRNRTLLYVGRIDRSSAWKGLPVLIASLPRTLKSVPDARLRLVGGGSAVEDLKRLAERTGVAHRVEFSGYLHGPDLVSAYQEAAATVLPSVTSAESFGMTLIEAMACGCPVIGSAVGGISHVIDDGVTGLVVPPRDPAALSDACVALLTDRELAQTMGEHGVAQARARYSWERRLDQYLSLFRDWLDKPKPPTGPVRVSAGTSLPG